MQSTNNNFTDGVAEQLVLQRITSVALITGGAIALASPVVTHSSYGDPMLWAWVRALGILAVLLGFSNVHHYLRFGAAAAWARVGVQTLLISSAGLITAEGLLAGSLQADSDGAIPAAVTNMQDLVQVFSYAALSTIGLAMTLSSFYPGWCGKGLLLIGAAAAVAAAAGSSFDPVTGLDQAASVTAALLGVWIGAVGAWSVRRAWGAESEL